MHENRLILNGKFVSGKEFTGLDRAFRYGDSLFETIRIRNKKPVLWEAHLQRLIRGMELLQFDFSQVSISKKLQEAYQKLLEACHFPNHARFRVQIFRAGEGTFFPTTDIYHYVAELIPIGHDPYLKSASVRLGIFRDITLPYHEFSSVKGFNSNIYIQAALSARKRGVDDSLLLSGKGGLAETCIANIFFIRESELISPSLSSGCLPGVLRAEVIGLAAQNGISCLEKEIYPEDLPGFDAAFLTNMIRGFVAVSQIEDIRFREKHPLFETLRKKWLKQHE